MSALGVLYFELLVPNAFCTTRVFCLELNVNPQVLAYETSGSSNAAGWGSSRYLFSETDSGNEDETRRFVALDFRGGAAGGEGAGYNEKPGWALGVGYDGNGALGLGQPAELSR